MEKFLPIVFVAVSWAVAVFVITFAVVRQKRVRALTIAQNRRLQEDAREQREREYQLAHLNTRGRGAHVLFEENEMMKARQRAHERLLTSMTQAQRNQYHTHGYFDVVSNLGHVFRLRTSGYVGNISQVTTDEHDSGIAETTSAALAGSLVFDPFSGPHFCMHLYNSCETFPADDHLLAQALLIRTDELAFRRTACNL